MKNIPHVILPVTSFRINYYKAHKPRLKGEIECDLYKITQKT